MTPTDFEQPPSYLVLGATGGIGSALCRQLVERGARLVVAARNAEKLRALADELGAHPFSVDATQSAQVDACVARVLERHGRLDGVAHCVGSLLLKPAHLTSDAEWDAALAVNLTSAFAVVRASARAMKDSGGSIVLVSSAAARAGLANHEAVAAAKAGIIGLVLSAAATYASRGIRVNGVAPGLVRTPLTAALTSNEATLRASTAMHALGRIGEPADVASAIAWLLDPRQGLDHRADSRRRRRARRPPLEGDGMKTQAATTLIQETRIRRLNDRGPTKGEYVLYWMQQSQRAELNHALEYAVQRANDLNQPLLVGFGLMDDYPEANLRHYHFMLQGLQETQQALHRRGLRMAVRRGSPDAVALRLARGASLVVCDRGYLRHQKFWRRRVSDSFDGEVVQVESDIVVPVEVASDKAEHAARTLRPRIHRHLDDYLVDLSPTPMARDSLGLDAEGLDLGDLDSVLSNLKLDRNVPTVPLFRGGTSEAKTRLRHFLRRQLEGYADHRNRPETDSVSHMSKYLHFGQISPVYVALQIREAASHEEDRANYLEELVVRRELAHNFVHFTEDYDLYTCLPGWARATLDEHRDDERPQLYTKAQLDAAETRDSYWNAAMREMKYTGYMHNHMRMYWGKKILEWSRTPESAYRVALDLNNRYFLDGRDPASYANIAWIFGLHDRPWPGRAVYGNVRSMSAGGLERKADMAAYVDRVDELVRKAQEP